MDARELQRIVAEKVAAVKNVAMRVMPIKAGALAKSQFQDNFRQSGFLNNGLQAWPPAQRQSGKGTNASYKTLLSGRNHLFSSIKYTTGEGRVVIENAVPYAIVHNEGYNGVQYVKPHKSGRLAAMSLQRRKNLRVGGGNVKGFSRKVQIPKRQFMGESAELTKKIEDKFDSEILKIIKS